MAFAHGRWEAGDRLGDARAAEALDVADPCDPDPDTDPDYEQADAKPEGEPIRIGAGRDCAAPFVRSAVAPEIARPPVVLHRSLQPGADSLWPLGEL